MEIFRWMRRDLGLPCARGGAVTFVQRFGGSLNLHVHFHVLVLDGIFERIGPGAPAFVPARPPTAVDLSRVVERVARATRRWIQKHAATSARADPDALSGCTRLAVQRGLFADLAPRAEDAGEDDQLEAPRAVGRKSASYDGFDLHAAVRVGADDDVTRERLVRYCARPAFAFERISVLPDGRIAYALKNPRRGASHRVLTPVELLARIAALIPPPRHPSVRFHGVLAPASKWRAMIVPRVATPDDDSKSCAHAPHAEPSHARPGSDRAPPNATPQEANASIAVATVPAANPTTPSPSQSLTRTHLARLEGGRLVATTPRLDWSTLLRRTFAEDVLVCPHCRGRTRILAAVTAPAVIRRTLTHLHEPPARAPPSGAREPMFEDADCSDEPA